MSVKISCGIIFNECRSSCRCATENIPLNTRMTHKPNLIAVICFGTAPSTEMKYEKELKKNKWTETNGVPVETMSGRHANIYHAYTCKKSVLCVRCFILLAIFIFEIFLQRFHVQFCYWLALLHDCKWQRL